MAGFCELASGLQAPIWGIRSANLAIVSGSRLKNSRFPETEAGDRVRSALRGGACSVTCPILCLERRQIGKVDAALPRGQGSMALQNIAIPS
jgi:hypothetical protein